MTIGLFVGCAEHCAAQSTLITFETIPNGVPSEGLVISNQFVTTHGVSFHFEDDTFPHLAMVGEPLTAFEGVGHGADTPASGQQVGQFFLTDDGVN